MKKGLQEKRLAYDICCNRHKRIGVGVYPQESGFFNRKGMECYVEFRHGDHGVGSEVNPESWTQLKGSLQNRPHDQKN